MGLFNFIIRFKLIIINYKKKVSFEYKLFFFVNICYVKKYIININQIFYFD